MNRHDQREMIGRLILLTAVLLLQLFSSSCNSVPLDERFLDDRLERWTVIDDPDTVEIPSDWRVEDGWVHQFSNIWGRRGDFLGRWFGTYLIAGDAAWDDYQLSVKAKPDDNDGFGLVFRLQDAQHFYRLLFLNDGLSGGPLTRLDKREGDDYTEIWSTRTGYLKGKEMTVEIEVESDILRVSIDGKALIETRDATYRNGKIGLFCYAQSRQAFDNVRVLLK